MNKLIVVIMGPGKKHFAEMALESVKDADVVLYWTSGNYKEIEKFAHITNETLFFDNGWDKTDPATNGKCRQKYLEYLKKNYPDDWALVLDEDEILEEGGIQKIKDYINQEPQATCCSVWMEHFVGDLGHFDNTQQWHFVPHRLFKISDVDKYPEHSHPVLIPKDENKVGKFVACKIFHLGHLPIEYLDYIKHRYEQHSKDSIIHSQDFLKQWKNAHLLGLYPTRQVNLMELPKQLCERYDIDKDEFYFANRQTTEAKHFIMMSQWLKYFKPKNVLDVGCGTGIFGSVLKILNEDIEYKGLDKSKYAVNSNKTLDLEQQDITKGIVLPDIFDFVIVSDVLEHLPYESLDFSIKLISKIGKQFLFSIPFIGDPNLEADPTHIIRETKEWWVNKLSEYFIITDAPKDWLFHEQLLIGEKK